MEKSVLYLVAGTFLGVAGWLALKDQQVASPSSGSSDQAYFPGVYGVAAAAPGLLEVVVNAVKNTMTNVDTAIQNPNVTAFLMLIRTGEGTADPDGYHRLFGGANFFSYADHPRIVVSRGTLKSTAAGAYQILARTWDDLRNQGVDLPDFSPANQDKAAIALIKRRGALAYVEAGNWADAIARTNREWASLPGSPYGQPTLTLDRAFAILAANGGTPPAA